MIHPQLSRPMWIHPILNTIVMQHYNIIICYTPLVYTHDKIYTLPWPVPPAYTFSIHKSEKPSKIVLLTSTYFCEKQLQNPRVSLELGSLVDKDCTMFYPGVRRLFLWSATAVGSNLEFPYRGGSRGRSTRGRSKGAKKPPPPLLLKILKLIFSNLQSFTVMFYLFYLCSNVNTCM